MFAGLFIYLFIYLSFPVLSVLPVLPVLPFLISEARATFDFSCKCTYIVRAIELYVVRLQRTVAIEAVRVSCRTKLS